MALSFLSYSKSLFILMFISKGSDKFFSSPFSLILNTNLYIFSGLGFSIFKFTVASYASFGFNSLFKVKLKSWAAFELE